MRQLEHETKPHDGSVPTGRAGPQATRRLCQRGFLAEADVLVRGDRIIEAAPTCITTWKSTPRTAVRSTSGNAARRRWRSRGRRRPWGRWNAVPPRALPPSMSRTAACACWAVSPRLAPRGNGRCGDRRCPWRSTGRNMCPQRTRWSRKIAATRFCAPPGCLRRICAMRWTCRRVRPSAVPIGFHRRRAGRGLRAEDRQRRRGGAGLAVSRRFIRHHGLGRGRGGMRAMLFFWPALGRSADLTIGMATAPTSPPICRSTRISSKPW